MIEGLDNRTRIPYYKSIHLTLKTRHITDYKLEIVILILQAFTPYTTCKNKYYTTVKLFARFSFDPQHH
jgi:hypothetical protein